MSLTYVLFTCDLCVRLRVATNMDDINTRSTSLLYLSRFLLYLLSKKQIFTNYFLHCNEVTFSCKYLLSTSLLFSKTSRY